jgi:crossover junction endodeoxyribonuclease RuvC
MALAALPRQVPVIIGIDPGLDGALAFWDMTTKALRVVDMPVLVMQRGGKNRREVDPHGLVEALRGVDGQAFIEQVWAQPAGLYASAQLLLGYGIVLGTMAALSIPYTVVSPQRWKRSLAVPKAKDGARARASQLLPQHAGAWVRRKDDGRAEAALIALYGAIPATERMR